jgi:DNA-3-methyladenine glycosylase
MTKGGVFLYNSYMRKVLGKKFFEQPTLVVARSLLGKYMVRQTEEGTMAEEINEVEAYFGFEDEASHAYKGETKRTSVMFGKAGIIYVYLIYGMYEMLNIVVDKEKYPAAILIRGVGKYNGPGKVTRAFNITKSLNKKSAKRASGLWFEDRGVEVKNGEILRAPRIGIKYAGEKWQKKPYRFILKRKK